MENMDKFYLTHGTITDGNSIFIEDGAIQIDNGTMTWIGPGEEMEDPQGFEIDMGGRMLIPGLINPHHHLYSYFATGLAPCGETGTFLQILENLWWHLDRNLDEESVYYSALAAVMDAVRYGITTIFDHHASMSWVSGSLSTLGKAFDTVGIRGLLCYETSDRNGDLEVAKHIRENIDFWKQHRDSDNLKGCFGLHANLTLSEETMEAIAEMKPPGMPIHIHCGEAEEDLDYCVELGYTGPVDRLYSHGLLDERSILAHAVHLSTKDLEILREISPVLVSLPESNANNRVGSMNREKLNSFVLGTDGMGCDMIQTLRSYYLLGNGNQESFEEMRKLFFDRPQKVLNLYFPGMGTLEPGNTADLAILNYIPLSPVSRENVISHLIFGARSARSWMTISRGRIIWREEHFPFLNEKEILVNTKKAVKALRKRFMA